MKKYLEIVGFDMSELDNENRNIYLSTLESCKTDPVKKTVLMGRRPVMQTSYKSESYKGFDINANGAKEATKKYKDCDEGNKKYNDGLNIVFRTEESANKEKEEAIKAEEAAKAAKDKKTTEEIKNKAPEQKSEPNIFEKIGTGIKNFFKNLFG